MKINKIFLKEKNNIKQEDIFKSPRTRSNNLQNQFISKYKNSIFLKRRYNLKNPLFNTKISKILRQKLIEILFVKISNLKSKNTFPLFFKTIEIMDLYIKLEKKIILKNENLFLIGITSLFITSKYLNIDYLDILNICKIPKERIIEKEFEILSALNYQISFFCYYDHMEFFLYNLFDKDSSKNILLLENILCKFLLIIIIEDYFYDFEPRLVIGAILINSIRYFFSKFVLNDKKINKKNNINFFNQEKKIIKSIMIFFKSEKKDLLNLSKKTKNFLINFKKVFKDFKKINKYLDLKENFFK